jgi:hypothetical protein
MKLFWKGTADKALAEQCSLCIALPSYGNAGQMAADCVLSSSSSGMSWSKVGSVLSEDLVPMTGYETFRGENSTPELCSPMNLYSNGEGFLFLIQRSSPALGKASKFYNELAQLIITDLPCPHKILLTGASLETIPDPSQRNFYIPALHNDASSSFHKNARFQELLAVLDQQCQTMPGYVLTGGPMGVDMNMNNVGGGSPSASTFEHLKRANPLLDSVLDFSTKVRSPYLLYAASIITFLPPPALSASPSSSPSPSLHTWHACLTTILPPFLPSLSLSLSPSINSHRCCMQVHTVAEKPVGMNAAALLYVFCSIVLPSFLVQDGLFVSLIHILLSASLLYTT